PAAGHLQSRLLRDGGVPRRRTGWDAAERGSKRASSGRSRDRLGADRGVTMSAGDVAGAQSCSGHLADPLQAVEDQVQPEREVALIVRVARLHVLLDVLREIRQVVDRELSEELL